MSTDSDDDFDILDDWLDLSTYGIETQLKSGCVGSFSSQRFFTGLRTEANYSPATSESSTSTLSTEYDDRKDVANDSELDDIDKMLDALLDESFPPPFKQTKRAVKNLSCAHCSRAFSRLYDKIRHERIHTGELPYPCRECNKWFRRSDARERHWKGSSSCREGHAEAIKNSAEGVKLARRHARRLEKLQK